jgi:hypothetical protein
VAPRQTGDLEIAQAELGVIEQSGIKDSRGFFRALLPLAAAALVWAASCVDLLPACHGDALRVVPTVPDTVTVRVGGSATATAGEAYGICESPPAREYDWRVSSEGIVSVSSVDGIHARISGLRPGQATVTPQYRHSSASLSSVTVTVVP